MFAGEHSDISHRKSVDISVWPQKEGKTVWILAEQQYIWERCPLSRGQDLGFGLAQWVLKEQGPNPVGYGTPCSLLQPRRIHGWAID